MQTSTPSPQVERIINYTNNRLANWYVNAKRDYGVIGSGEVVETDDKLIVKYVEDGMALEFDMNKQVVLEEGIDYLFNVWMELA